ncbi:alpha/beta fold hydrolase [Arachnia propionica]|uniref:Alpha/beta fold hydrolase n=1 Tax=Arachnia propionica TaxID=1750 RepID=A0A3P1TCY0_9ACTN|nr:alpha/beta fold hydrolase [Arachnia propionica]MDO5082587.1 alpha/beta fold hydrolase [Arachnia propionica]RRD07080.1 alpha/beta fold hydrolase [Arachnia propionica]
MIHATTIGSGPAQVVFLHGLFGRGKNFTRIAEALSDLATCHLVDLPNHGSSSWTIDFSLDGQTYHIASWIAENFTGPVSVIGHSLGGKLAMRLALSYPEAVERLLVADISPARSEGPASFAPLVAAMQGLNLETLTSRTAASDLLKPDIPDPVVRGFLLQNLRKVADGWAWDANLDLLGDSLSKIGGWPPTDAVYEGPTWWVSGGRSPYVQPEHTAPMKELFPLVVSVRLKRAGHWVHADEPEAFITLCREFLTSGSTLTPA